MANNDDEAVFGRNLRAHRAARGWSQEHLARLMVEAGFPWHQTTVAKTEAADRPIRINEAAALARLMNVELQDLLLPYSDSDRGAAMVRMLEAQASVQNAEQRRANILAQLEQARAQVDRLLYHLEEENRYLAQAQAQLNEALRTYNERVAGE